MKLVTLVVLPCVAVMGLGACGVGSTITRKISLPADWKNAAGFPVASPTRDLSRWWNKFGDPTLTRIISDALGNSPDMASAAARIRESQARRRAEAASLFPSLSGSASVGSSASRRDGPGTASDTNYSAGLNASWEADLFGKRRSSLEAAAAQVEWS